MLLDGPKRVELVLAPANASSGGGAEGPMPGEEAREEDGEEDGEGPIVVELRPVTCWGRFPGWETISSKRGPPRGLEERLR